MTRVDVSVAEGVASVHLRPRGDGPDAVNSLDEEALEQLSRAFVTVRQDPRVRVAVISGSGPTFCVGLDLALLGRGFSDHAYFRDVLARFAAVLLAIEDLPVPVVAAVNGTTRAGGLELVLACDLVLVAEEARLADHHLAFGILPGGGATHRLPRKIGEQRARELIYTARWLSGSEAVHYGLALRAVPRVELPGAVEELAGQLRDKSRACLAATKATMHEVSGQPVEDAVQVELEAFTAYLERPGSDEGYRAWVERRPPRWADG